MKLRQTLALTLTLSSALSLAPAANAANLLDIYQLARDNDSVIQATIAQHDAAIEALPLARSALRPNVALVADKAINETNNDGTGIYESDSYGASFSQNVYAPEAWQSAKKAKLAVEQAALTLKEAEQNLMFRTAQAYFNILTAEETFRAASSSREAIARQTEQSEQRFEVGLSAITDVKEAQAQLDLAIAREVVAENQLSVAKEALRVIIGQAIPSLNPLSSEATLTNPSPASVDEWIAMAENNSPRLQIADLDQALAEKDIAIERAARKPTIALNGGYTNSTTEASTGRDVESGQLQLQLTYPLYTGGRTNALIRQAKARATQARFNRETVRRAVEQETRDAYLSVIADVSQANALRQALASTEVAREATQAGFDAGTRTAVELLVSLRDTFSARADYAAARHQYVVRSLQLRLASGLLAEKHIEAVNRSLQP
jgi:outer membrane protein